ncbi:hypothetical protein [Stenotrophomonas sp. GD04032]|uniref:HNH endonuclease n=3 Tax=Stenotrophomonas TaxID=40323 RepID=A0AA41CE17_STEMA|nr:hypothetical protein [Stenotrophomonas sp. GD04032]MBH1788932.1 hypothetical protein [Stenotrophomonas maltophilia]MDG9975506.1 hypothetical protein [Stenotrophomonas sp. GD04032]UXB32638.1 hypothetical protein K7564_02075 [Stenotrophomonas maltophilia]
MLVKVNDMWPRSVEIAHSLYTEGLIELEEKRARPWGGAVLGKFVNENKRAITTGGVEEILTAIASFDDLCGRHGEDWRARSLKKLQAIFDYGKFVRASGGAWGAYELCSRAKYGVCPYCQQSLSLTVVRDNNLKCFRPTLDHYFSKSDYPFLALSLNNLVPSCYACNSSLKGSANFYRNRHKHPYHDEEWLTFSMDMDAYFRGRSEGSGVWKISISYDGRDKCQVNTMKTFAIKERYAKLEWMFERFAERACDYYLNGGGRYRELFNNTDYDAVAVVRLDFDEANYKGELLGKMKRDVCMKIRASIGV